MRAIPAQLLEVEEANSACYCKIHCNSRESAVFPADFSLSKTGSDYQSEEYGKFGWELRADMKNLNQTCFSYFGFGSS